MFHLFNTERGRVLGSYLTLFCFDENKFHLVLVRLCIGLELKRIFFRILGWNRWE